MTGRPEGGRAEQGLCRQLGEGEGIEFNWESHQEKMGISVMMMYQSEDDVLERSDKGSRQGTNGPGMRW